jgi:hypothetical protein
MFRSLSFCLLRSADSFFLNLADSFLLYSSDSYNAQDQQQGMKQGNSYLIPNPNTNDTDDRGICKTTANRKTQNKSKKGQTTSGKKKE